MSNKERLAAARAAKEALEQVRAAKAEERETELLELELRLEKDCGPRGAEFELLDTPDGPIALKRGEGVLHTAFQNSKFTEADMFNYVFPCVVHPDKEAFKKMLALRPGLHLRCANALSGLYGAKTQADAGKF